MKDLKDKKVLVIGLGRAGAAAARFAAERGARVTVSERKDEAAVKEHVKKLSGVKVDLSFGANDPKLMKDSDVIILSPGVPLTIEGLEEAREKGVPIINELELAVSEIATPMIAVTGTNGKTTTTALIGHLLGECGIKNCVGGNIGTALTGLIDEAKRVDWVVVEVSSFQLETTPSLAPKIGVLLNITPDHLDRHSSFEEYIELKMRLLRALGREGTGLYNARDSVVAGGIRKLHANLVPFNSVAKMDKGGWFEDGSLCTKVSKETRRYGLGKVSLVGAHNRENMLASVMVAELCGGKKERIQKGLESFKGLPHRIELVEEHGGIRYYDDSKGTNVGATASALENFAGPVILIAGGLDKGASYSSLAPLIKGRVKRLILIGEAKEKMMEELGNITETVTADSMEEAVCKANSAAKKGDVVLLSPACASYDMFRDYAERGEVFARAVKKRCWVKE